MKTNRKSLSERFERRSRWLVATAAALLIWPAWWYCRGGSQGLFIMTAILAGVAVLLPYALPKVTRWVIWTWIGVTVILFAANVDRLMPPDQASYYYEHIMDRLITAFYAVGVASLFFRLTHTAVSTMMISVLPMLMLTLSRIRVGEAWLLGAWNVPLVGFVILAVILDHVSQLLRKPEEQQPPLPFWREMGWRALLFGVLLLGVVTLRQPVQQSVEFVQKQIFGLVTRTLRSGNRQTDLSLSRPLPKGFAHRTRILIVMDGREAPGYLREYAYTNYHKGSWLLPKQSTQLPIAGATESLTRRDSYRLVPATEGVLLTTKLRNAEILAPHLLNALPLPGHAQTFTSDKRDYKTDDNGVVVSENILPERYEITLPDPRRLNTAYPLPCPDTFSPYLTIPPDLTNAVKQWVSDCEGFAGEPKPLLAARLLERYFQDRFTYNLETDLSGRGDPIVAFMEQREGFCIHFASAAALMLRARGIPARMVSGLSAFGYDAWLGRWVVRERDRHAWVEFWDETEKQWFILDATPMDDRPAAHAQVSTFRRLTDFLLTSWKRFFYWLKTANFLLVIAEAGIWTFELLAHFLRTPLGWLTILFVLGILWWRRRLRLLRLSLEERYKLALLKKMERSIKRKIPAALRRLASESWDHWLLRIHGKIPEQSYQQISAEVEAYQQLRYRTRKA